MLNKIVISALVLSFLLLGYRGKKLIAGKDGEIAELKKNLSQLQSDDLTRQKQKDRLTQDLRKQISGIKQKEKILIMETADRTTVTLPNAVLFASASAELTEEGQKIINELWKVFINYPKREIMIQGHTDNKPISQKYQGKYKSNWELSSNRAHSVLHHVTSQKGTHPERLAAVGYGNYRPVADNATAEGRAKNRRVVITVLGKIAQ